MSFVSGISGALLAVGAFALLFFSAPAVSSAQSNDEAEIRALEDRFAEAFKAKDVDRIMANYEHSQNLVVFDVVPRREFLGWQAYKKDWQDFFASIGSITSFEVKNLAVSSDGTLAYSYSFQHSVAKTNEGGTRDITLRVTDVYRKISGRWLIVQEHVSVPVDFRTGNPDLRSGQP